jgi:starvation-inducible DNA-binding protein
LFACKGGSDGFGLSPARLSQDFNIYSRNFTDGAGRLRYLPDERRERGLTKLEGLTPHLRNYSWQPLAPENPAQSCKERIMSKSDPPYILHPTRIDLPPEIRVDVITLLNRTLAYTVDLRSQVKQACWNVKGKDFIPLHALFTTIADALDAYADLVAERIAVLGGVVMGTTRMAATLSQLPEYPSTLVEGNDHVVALVERFAHYATVMRGGITQATDVEDAGSAAVYTDISRGVDKQLWILEAHLQR